MKKLSFSFFFIVLVIGFTKAQNYLTYRQVYDFNVGDIIEYEGQTDDDPPILYRTTVIGKWYSVNTDTIDYDETWETYSLCRPPCTPTYTFASGIELVYDLDSAVNIQQNAFLQNCQSTISKFKDTLYNSLASCGMRVYECDPIINYDSCFEPIVQSDYVIEGCGGPYYSGGDATVPMSYRLFLTYYKKGNDTCGQHWVYTGIPEINGFKYVKISTYPNPSSGILILQVNDGTLKSKATINVYNMLGQQIYSNTIPAFTNQSSIDLAGQPTGIYQYRITDETGNLVSNGKFVIQK